MFVETCGKKYINIVNAVHCVIMSSVMTFMAFLIMLFFLAGIVNMGLISFPVAAHIYMPEKNDVDMPMKMGYGL